jgi:hypothetical protein
VQGEIASQTGIHGKIAGVQACAGCHSEHRGQDYDLNTQARVYFDHSLARFNLVWHQVNYDSRPMSCWECHTDEGGGLAFSGEACAACHQAHNPEFMGQHLQDFGKGCLDCHDGQDRMVSFDHKTTAFPLEGNHAQLGCVQCHTHEKQASQPGRPLEGMPADCAACHTEPAIHQGEFDPDCSQCHHAAGWKPAILAGVPFIHEQNASFSLARHTQDYSSQPISCSGCHPSSIQAFDPHTCVGCHSDQDERFMKQHQETFGSACLGCHDGVDRMHAFDHAQIFPLDGRHGEIGCEKCHANARFRGTPTVCVECHAEPEIHAGFFGLVCDDCHTAKAWSPAFLKKHNFPLDHGGQGQVKCGTCHPTKYIENTCYGCHDHQPDPIAQSHRSLSLSAQELGNCAACHPAGKK